MRKTIIMACFLWITSPIFSYAKTNSELYIANIPIQANNETNDNAAFSQGLREVLIRVGGNSKIVDAKNLQSAIAHAKDIVDEYRFLESPSTSSEVPSKPQLMMQIKYDPASVRRLLNMSNEPVWNTQRPMTLVWMAIETPEGKQLLGNDSKNDALTYLRSAANVRGLPILLPLLDLQDINLVSADQVWNSDMKVLTSASTRYGYNTLLIAQVKQLNPTAWQASWNAVVGKKTIAWQDSSDSLDKVLNAGVNHLADKMAHHFAKGGDTKGSVWLSLQVSGINSIEQLDEVKKYLVNLPPVNLVEANEIQPTEVKFQVKVNGGMQALTEALNGGTRLVPRPQQQAKNQPPLHELMYQWVS